MIKPAVRDTVYLKACFGGPSGSGKTKSALRLACGLVGGDWTKVGCIDSENGSAGLYSDMGPFMHLKLRSYMPEDYIMGIQKMLKLGIQCIVVDSITQEWETVLEIHGAIAGQNTYANWKEVTPRHNEFKRAILNCNAHVITTVRKEEAYVLELNDKGKQVPRKVGMKDMFKQGWAFENTLYFDVNSSHEVVASKDRTGLFADEMPFQVTEETGKQIKEWLGTGGASQENEVQETINSVNEASSLDELLFVYRNTSPAIFEIDDVKSSFTLMKNKLKTA